MPTCSSATTTSSGCSPTSRRGSRRTGSWARRAAARRRTADSRTACCRSNRSRSDTRVRRRPASGCRPAAVAAALSDRRKLSRHAARELSASARSVHGARRDVSARAAATQRTSSAPISSARRRSDRRRSCIASRRATTRRCRSPTTSSTRRTSPPACCAPASTAGAFTFEASVFRGEEPDENRLEHRDAAPRFVGGARRLAARTVAGAVVGRPPARAGMVRAVRRHAADGVDRVRRRRSARARSPRRSRGAKIASSTASTSVSDGYLLEWDLRATRRDVAVRPRGGVAKGDLRPRLSPERVRTTRTSSRTSTRSRSAPSTTCRSCRVGPPRRRRRHHRLSHVARTWSPYFGGSRSFHVFLRWRPNGASTAHVH